MAGIVFIVNLFFDYKKTNWMSFPCSIPACKDKYNVSNFHMDLMPGQKKSEDNILSNMPND